MPGAAAFPELSAAKCPGRLSAQNCRRQIARGGWGNFNTPDFVLSYYSL
jgi:hypothetical protein